MRPGDRLSHYELIERIGEGGMGVVWKALDTTLERPVALKLLGEELAGDPARLARLEREARTLAALNHPAIVTVHSVERAGDTGFLTMEWVEGRTLADLIPPEGLPLTRLLEVALPIVEGLVAAHGRGVTHRDIKPANVMLTDSGRVKVLDFGLSCRDDDGAAVAPEDASTRTVEDSSGLSGTLPYMAPELLQGHPPDARSDLYATGVLLYEMATGRRPFEGASAPELTAAILRDTPRPVTALRPDLPVHLDWLIRRCLEKEPERRFAGARELHAELEVLHRARALQGAEGRSVAVLPFTDLSQHKDQEYFCDGIAEEITSALARVRGLSIASRTAALQFRNTQLAPREIGGRLGVQTLLAGSVRKAGEQLRVTVALTDVEDGYVRWSERFDRTTRDIFAIQDEIADNVVRALAVSLSPDERLALRRMGTTNPEAYEYFLRGRKFLYQQSRRGIALAQQMFARAIELDPAYALAHAGIAYGLALTYLYVDSSPAVREGALAASQRALELDPKLAIAHVALGLAWGLFGRHEEAVATYQQALELEPDLYEALFFFAREIFMYGDREEAVRLYERACRVRPEDYQVPGLLAQLYKDLGRDAESAVVRRRCISNAEEHLKTNPDDIRAYYISANAMVVLGEIERGIEWTRMALAVDPTDCMVRYNAGCIFAITGRVDEALEHIERCVELGNIQYRYFKNDTDLDPLRGQPRFEAALRTLAARQGESPD